MALKRNMSTPEDREFWRSVSAASRAVAEWPSWKLVAEEFATSSHQPRASEQTFTGQFEGNIPERLKCVEKTIDQFRKAHTSSGCPVREE